MRGERLRAAYIHQYLQAVNVVNLSREQLLHHTCALVLIGRPSVRTTILDARRSIARECARSERGFRRAGRRLRALMWRCRRVVSCDLEIYLGLFLRNA